MTGCLGDDIWREPFVWRSAAELGENRDAAEAFAAGAASLGDQAVGQGDAVIETAEDLPDNVVFQNAKDFLNQRRPGAGDTFDENVHVVTGEAADAYLTLTGPAAAAYGSASGPVFGTQGPVAFEVPDRTLRMRWTLHVVLTGQEAPEAGQNPTPLGRIDVRIIDPMGDLAADYKVDTSRQIKDMVIQGTFGDANEVRGHLGGTWKVEVDANAEGGWSLVVESYEPELDDYRSWQFWRAERRQVGR